MRTFLPFLGCNLPPCAIRELTWTVFCIIPLISYNNGMLEFPVYLLGPQWWLLLSVNDTRTPENVLASKEVPQDRRVCEPSQPDLRIF